MINELTHSTPMFLGISNLITADQRLIHVMVV